jgi:glycosyltransferase involved in cell wall biosynthesis
VNILFVNYGDFTTNSLNHIGGFAGALKARGHSCVVAVPDGLETLDPSQAAAFAAALYSDVLAKPALFPGGGLAQVIHAWTPRECVRKFVLAYQRTARTAAKLVIHLEDNEEHLVGGFTGRSPGDLRSMGFAELDPILTENLPHPVRHRTFLRLADSVTVIVDRLREFVPEGIPVSLLRPGVDPVYFAAAGSGPDPRRVLGLRDGERAVVYTGSSTFANEPEMKELYAAVGVLNQRGTPTRLVRTGFSRPVFLESLGDDLRAHVLDLGFVPKERLPALLRIADALVQPGRPSPFNDYRLPSKLPEFLASGRPVILPPTNIAREMKDGAEALFLSDGSAANIADCCERVFGDPTLAAALGKRGAAFAAAHFDLGANTAGLLKVYEAALAAPPRAGWQIVREYAGSDLAAAAAEVAEGVKAGKPVGAGTSALAADLAVLVRLEDQRQVVEAAAHERARLELESAVLRLETQRDMTAAHVRNLEARVSAQDSHIKLQKKLSERHVQNLEAMMIEIERRSRVEMDRLTLENAKAMQLADSEIAKISRDNAEISREHAKLSSRILEMEAELLARERRLKEIFASVSWKLAAPTRDIEGFLRKAFGRKPAAQPAAPAPPPAARHEGPAPPEPVTPEPPSAARAYGHTFNFDHPWTWSTSSNKLLILGWCFENSGAPIRAIRARFAGELFDGVYGSKRLDVLAATGRPQAEFSGLKIDVRTHLGDHPLAIEVQHGDEWTAIFNTVVHVGKAGDPMVLSEYEKWCQQHESLGAEDLAAIAAHIAAFRERPVISVVMPVYNTPAELLTKAVNSVVGQVYPFWELCIADDASTAPHIRGLLRGFTDSDPRIKAVHREKNGHICEATNTALSMATGDYVALFDHDDVLSSAALYEVAAEIDAHPDAQFIYSDEDKIDVDDRRFDPYFKPDWNPDLNRGQNYTSHLSVYRTKLIRSLGGFRKGFEGSQDWDLFLRAIEKMPVSAIRHIPKLLYHWRAVPGSTALQLAEKSYPVEAARLALADHFRRVGEPVELLPVPGDHWRVKYPLPSPPPSASLIIPTRNAVALLRQAVESILTITDYPDYEVVIVDNHSDDPETLAYLASVPERTSGKVRVLPFPGPFNYSAINNLAVRESRGEVVGLLNNDVEAIDRHWLTEMVSQACRPGIGAVGAMLYYPNNTVQHAGVVLGLGGVAGHPYKAFPRGDQGQKNRLRLAQNYSAVTGACLVIRKDRFLEVGGFNDRDLPIAFNDVDLCCKLISAGYRNLWTPHAEFYHHESATRGSDNTPDKIARFHSEIEYMTKTWGSLLMTDPAYNPNLTLVGEDFSPAYLSRTTKPWVAHKM